jgi:hypothetical protein
MLTAIALALATACGNAASSTQTGTSSQAGAVAIIDEQLASDYARALDTMVITVNKAIDDANAAITSRDNKALASALQREKAAREDFLASVSVLTFPARIQTQVTEMLTALRALITDIRRLIESVGDNQLYNHYVDQKDQDKADMYAAVKLIDHALNVPDTVPSASPPAATGKP